MKNEKKNWFQNACNFCDNDILLLRKVAYPYENVDDLEKLHEATLPEKYEFYSNLNMEDITDTDNMHSKRACKDFE